MGEDVSIEYCPVMVVIRTLFFNAISFKNFPIFIKLQVMPNAKFPIKDVFF